MKIITTNINDFIAAEIDEWGFDYVEAKFADGYEPTLISGIWCWHVSTSISNIANSTSTSRASLDSSGNRVRLLAH